MNYGCLIDVRDNTFVVARRKGHAWLKSDLEHPFELVKLAVVALRGADIPVVIKAKVGNITVWLGEIDPSIIDEIDD